MSVNIQIRGEAEHTGDRSAADHDLSLALVRDNARRSLLKVRDEIAAPGNDGRSLPLPVPGAAEVTIQQALEAAFLQIEAIRREGSDEASTAVDPLDWHEDLLEAVDLTHLSRARR